MASSAIRSASVSRNAGTCGALRGLNVEHHTDAEKEWTDCGGQCGRSSVLTWAQDRGMHMLAVGWGPPRHGAGPSPASGAGAARHHSTAGAGRLRRRAETSGWTQQTHWKAPRSKFVDLTGRHQGQNTAKLLQAPRAPRRRAEAEGRFQHRAPRSVRRSTSGSQTPRGYWRDTHTQHVLPMGVYFHQYIFIAYCS